MENGLPADVRRTQTSRWIHAASHTHTGHLGPGSLNLAIPRLLSIRKPPQAAKSNRCVPALRNDGVLARLAVQLEQTEVQK